MASRRMGAVALASACLAGSLAWSGVPAIASNSQAAPATTTTADETLDDEEARRRQRVQKWLEDPPKVLQKPPAEKKRTEKSPEWYWHWAGVRKGWIWRRPL